MLKNARKYMKCEVFGLLRRFRCPGGTSSALFSLRRECDPFDDVPCKDMERKRIIVDCDAGTDDALALVLLTAAHKVGRSELLAVTCVNGNTVIDNVVNNVFRTLHACGIPDIPVYKGAESQLLVTQNAKETAEELFHGVDGFGDVFMDKPDISELKQEHAVSALNRIVCENPGEITIVCLGPLTNIALAIRMYPEFISNVKEFYVMGGNHAAQGNITAQAEFNFYADPESVHIVLNSNDKPFWLLSWETCLKSRISHEWRQTVFGKINTPQVQLIKMIEDGAYSMKDKVFKHYKPCDAFVAGILLRPDMATEVYEYHADIELSGVRTRGQVVLDHLQYNKPNVNVIQNFDSEIFKELLIFAADPHNYNGNVFDLPPE